MKRLDYISWDEFGMAMALVAAQRSKDPNTQVGACILNSQNRIIGVGYNGFPNGCNDDDLPWGRDGALLDTKYPYVCHAEKNAILNSSNRRDLEGSTLYVTLFPCNVCAQDIIQAGIKDVCYLDDKYYDKDFSIAARKMLGLANIGYRKFFVERKELIIDFTNEKND